MMWEGVRWKEKINERPSWNKPSPYNDMTRRKQEIQRARATSQFSNSTAGLSPLWSSSLLIECLPLRLQCQHRTSQTCKSDHNHTSEKVVVQVPNESKQLLCDLMANSLARSVGGIKWVWASTKPGVTSPPRASITLTPIPTAAPGEVTISTTRPFSSLSSQLWCVSIAVPFALGVTRDPMLMMRWVIDSCLRMGCRASRACGPEDERKRSILGYQPRNGRIARIVGLQRWSCHSLDPDPKFRPEIKT